MEQMATTTTTQEPTMFTVFTESTSDHSRVFIIADYIANYDDASRIARQTSAIIAYSDQFHARFTPTSPNGMNGIRA